MTTISKESITIDTSVKSIGRMVILRNRRVLLYKFPDGYGVKIKRLPTPEERAEGHRVFITRLSMSHEAMEAMVALYFQLEAEEDK